MEPLETVKMGNMEENSEKYQYTDVTEKGCFCNSTEYFEVIPCVRDVVVFLFAILTVIGSGYTVIKLYNCGYPCPHQKMLVWFAFIGSIVSCVRVAVWKYYSLDFTVQWSKFIELLILNHLFLVTATNLNKENKWISWIVRPLFVISISYSSIVVVHAFAYSFPHSSSCFQPDRLAFSSGELVLVQVFLVAAVVITRRLNKISTLDSMRRTQRRDLWLLVISLKISAVCSFLYDVTFYFISDNYASCSEVFNHNQLTYSLVYGIMAFIKYMLHVWVLVFVFQPENASTQNIDILSPYSEDSQVGYTPVFVPPVPYDQQLGNSSGHCINSSSKSHKKIQSAGSSESSEESSQQQTLVIVDYSKSSHEQSVQTVITSVNLSSQTVNQASTDKHPSSESLIN